MTPSFPDLDITQWSIPQRIELIGQIWDSIPDSLDALPMPEWHREELDRRLKEADSAPDDAIPWEQVKERLQDGS